METIIIRTDKPALAIEVISKVLVATKSMKVVTEKIYVKCMKGSIVVCLS